MTDQEAYAIAVKSAREWQRIALQLRDLFITGKGEEIELTYFDAAFRIPFHGASSEPCPLLPSQLETVG